MALCSVPVLMYVQYTPLRYSKITIFASACRFLMQTLSPLPSMLVLVSQKGRDSFRGLRCFPCIGKASERHVDHRLVYRCAQRMNQPLGGGNRCGRGGKVWFYLCFHRRIEPFRLDHIMQEADAPPFLGIEKAGGCEGAQRIGLTDARHDIGADGSGYQTKLVSVRPKRAPEMLIAASHTLIRPTPPP
ncbi:flagellar P-ring protein FlgI [Brucella melitensis]|nr:flagellar P-ring protein FlgI [Brucella melitensis]